MTVNAAPKFIRGLLFLVLIAVALPATVNSHCDTMNGPVVTAAKKALETGNVNLVLIWVQKKDESEVKEAFQRTLGVRKLGLVAQEFADSYFFETLVRIHRAGEGVPYTGLKSDEVKVDPGISAADNALEAGSQDALLEHLGNAVRHGLDEQFKRVMAKKHFRPDDIEAGREYVKTYVEYIHYVERLYQATSQRAAGHFHEDAEETDSSHHRD